MGGEQKAGLILALSGAIVNVVVLSGHTNLRLSRDVGLALGTLALGGGVLLFLAASH